MSTQVASRACPAKTERAACWCGNTSLATFSDDYAHCTHCQTLVYRGTPAQPDPRVTNDADDFYGREYFFSHQSQNSGYATIASRARTDLPERCTFWLNALLNYKLPSARVLELGSAHGGFIALLRQAGFDATGLDLSPAIVETARKRFEVPILLGPVEDQRIAPASLDVIALMDVIEHMPDPVGTMRHCLSLLKPDGVILLQTPRYVEGKSFNEIVETGDRFAQQFRPGEHLNLFSQRSIAKLFGNLDAAHVQFLEPIFWFYDMFLVVSRQPIRFVAAEDRERALSQSTERRVVQALLDGEARFRDLLANHRALLRQVTDPHPASSSVSSSARPTV